MAIDHAPRVPGMSMREAARQGLIVGTLVAALVLLLAFVPVLARGYPLALLPLLAAGPAAARHGSPHLAGLLLRGFLAGLVAAVCAVAALVFAVEVLRASFWALTSPASYPPMPALPRPDLILGVGWPHEDILLLLPPLSAVLAVLYGGLLLGPTRGLVPALSARVASVRASIETKLLWVLLALVLCAVALGWVGFSALEDIHLRGHRLQLLLDWNAHALAIGDDLRALAAAATIDDPAPRKRTVLERAAELNEKLRHLEQPAAHPDIAVPLSTVQSLADSYRGELADLRAAADGLAAAAGRTDVGEQARLGGVLEAVAAAQQAELAFTQRLSAEATRLHNQTDLQHHASLIALMLLVAISATVGLVLGQAAATSITRPLGALALHVARIGHGDFERGPALQNRDEVGDLATRLDAMTIELERLYRAEREGRRTAEALNAQLSAKNQELESVRQELQRSKDLLEQRVEERTAALRDTSEQLRQSQKMEAIGRLAGGIAHDFNNLLTVMTGFNELLREQLAATDPLRGLADEVAKAGERAAALTQQLLAFSRRQVLAPQVLDLNAVVEDMDRMLRRVIGEDVELKLALAPDLAPVEADPGQLQQVILNLAVNARDAMPQGGTLTLETANAAIGTNGRGGAAGAAASAVLLTVRDTGCGMDADTLSHIFEPFFTTKAPGTGTGLGLATVYGVVQQSGGHIEVASQPGQGTTFRVYLPAAGASAAAGDSPADPATTASGGETILLVEDDDQVRDLARRVLEAKGYVVLEASHPEAGLRTAEERGDAIDLLLTDVIMPGMSGRELADRIAVRNTQLPVLYLSGYTDEAIGHHGVDADGRTLLHKPFTPSALATTVRDVLDRRERVDV